LKASARAFLRRLFLVATVIALLAPTTAPVFAAGGQTGTIAGTVIDSAGPVVGAAVVASSPSGTYRATTDTSGRYSMLGVVLDTYVVSATKGGYQTVAISGVTIVGDQSVTVPITLSKELRTIGRVSARSANSAFQPSQTQDSFTFSGNRVTEAQGKAFNTDQTALIASSPGVQVNVNGSLSVRGSLSTEIGLNLDGVDYTSVSHGGAAQTYLNGIGSLSVNPGAGDASVGNSGAGVINLIPKRGTRPAFGTVDLEATSGYFNHQAGAEYGFASANGRYSNYSSFTSNRFAQSYGPFRQPLAESGGVPGGNSYNDYTQTGLGFRSNDDFLNNFVYRFGKDNGQSLQLLYQTHAQFSTYDAGGPSRYGQYNYLLNDPTFGYGGAFSGTDGPYAGVDLLAAIAPLYPGQTQYGQKPGVPATETNLVSFLKLEYNRSYGPATFLAARYYTVGQVSSLSDPTGTNEQFGGSRTPGLDGGRRGGVSAELTHQFGDKNLVTLSGKYEVTRSIFSVADPFFGVYSFAGNGLVGRQDWADFLTPANKSAALTFPTYNANGQVLSHGANDCPSSYITSASGAASYPGGCYLYYYNTAINPGFFKNGVPRLPSNSLTSPPNPQDIYGFGLRDQITLSSKLRLDLGLRLDAENTHLPSGLETGNIGPDGDTNFPRVLEPRVSFAYQIDKNNAFRAGYGRSVIFQTGGNLYTPIETKFYYGLFPHDLASVPHDIAGTDFGLNPVPNGTNGQNGCGSGEFGNPIKYRACQSYADLAQYEQDYFAPDNGNSKPTTYNNYDATFAHQFKNGVGIKVTPFYKQGYQIGFFGLAAFKIDPLTGAVIPLSFRPFYNGVSKQTGAEFFASTAERASGFTGFLSATYVNSLANRPPGVPAEDSQPLVRFAALAAGNIYRSGYDSPFVVRSGLTYKYHGFRINPVITYDRGYPIGTGLLTPVVINGVGTNVPATNNSNSLPVQNPTSAIATGYVDPTNPGNVFKPNIYATRGTAEGASPGGVLSPPRVMANLTLEYALGGKTHSTVGIQAINLFNNYYSEPITNTRYQPVATGVPGPLSGQSAASTDATYQNLGVINYGLGQHAFSAYNLFPNGQPLTYRLYYQVGL
jgi:hypothetical protein